MDLKFAIEAILFSAQKPLNLRELRDILNQTADKAEEPEAKPFKKIPEEELTAALAQLEADHAQSGRSYFLACVAGAWQFVSRPEYLPWLRTLYGAKTRPPRLSQPALETLAVVAYRQPVTRAEIEQIRGVAVDGVVATLLERGLIQQAGRAEVVGRPMTYGTTPAFLEYFGLRNLEELPAADELRRIPVERPPSLLTVDPGLATATPDGLKQDPLAGDAGSAGEPVVGTAQTESTTTVEATSPDAPLPADAAAAPAGTGKVEAKL